MASFTGTLSAAGDVSPAVLLKNGQQLTYTLTESAPGDYVVLFQKSENPTANWDLVTSHDAEVSTTTVTNDSGKERYYRIICDDIDGVTVDYTLADATGESILAFVNPQTGAEEIQITDQGVKIVRDLTVVGSLSATLGDSDLVAPEVTAQATDAVIGAVAAPASGTTAVTIARVGPFFVLTFTLTAAQIAVTDGAGSGSYGALKLFDFAAGGISFLGSRQNYTVYVVDGTGVPDDAVFEIGVGTTAISAAADGALAADEDNVGGDVNQTLSSGTTTGTGFTNAAAAVDGTSTAADLYLNWSGTAATIDDDGTIDVTGTITVVGVLLGDD